ncbi:MULTISPECIES: ribose-phosphate diphosphokinase [Oleiagrimonas]|uniref:ribose-phosphate diphosphokinase n=1 Tax=Oleiagrimonas citrea TaxID=1665687 RepID=A0A846ZNA5_9GAMM|nr:MULTISPECIES: ribose-phosphate diphosphokinase [Oleiagrimonas]NKZ39040.1 ribose-phosphate diphosphokinase [Oleiagrimonas citrea]RAP57652.1 hypothetical protein BTJ49_07065 [Oleiagrimonas sp. MCCC 1A03011]
MIVFHAMPGNGTMAAHLAREFGGEARIADVDVHAFPDGESLVRVEPPDAETDAVLVCTLDHPDTVTVPLLMAAATLRELGARRVVLVAPYLAYMRQDKRFAPGQAVSARIYAAWLSTHFDDLVTVDPHLHRIARLDEVYTLRSRVVHAAPVLAAWIREQIDDPWIVGPDGESAQWARDVAARIGAPVTVLEKTRFGDTDVAVTAPEAHAHRHRTPVLLDDIISSGRTLAAVVEHLHAQGMRDAVCVAVHGLMAGDARELLRKAGVARVVCTNTVGDARDAIDVSAAIADGLRDLLFNMEEGNT